MDQDHRIGAVILMAGVGSRLGGDVPKQFRMLGSKRVYLHSVDAFAGAGVVDEIVLVCHPDWLEVAVQEAPYATIIKGGASRQESAYAGLLGFSQKPDIVLMHDAVRPFVSKEMVLENIQKTILHGAVNTCIASSDTLIYVPQGTNIESIPKREAYLRGQTPQGFRFQWIMDAHIAASREGLANVSDDCQLVLRRGLPVHVMGGSDRNFKITTEFDFKLAESFVI